MKELHGLGASAVIAVGPAFVFRRHAADTRAALPADDAAAEMTLFQAALARVKGDLAETAKRLAPSLGAEDVRLFEAQARMLDDPELVERAARLIRDRLCPAEQAIAEAGEENAARLETLPDDYLRARAATCAMLLRVCAPSSRACHVIPSPALPLLRS